MSIAGPSAVEHEGESPDSDDSCELAEGLGLEVMDNRDDAISLVITLGDFPRDKYSGRLPTPRASNVAGMARDAVLLGLVDGTSGNALQPLLGVVMPGNGPFPRIRVIAPRIVVQAMRRTLAAHVAKGKSSAGKLNSPCSCVVVKLESLVSSAVEYSSVATVAYTPFAGLIFRPTQAKLTPFCRGLMSTCSSVAGGAEPSIACPVAMPSPLFEALRLQYNSSQLAAILAVVSGGSYCVPGIMLDEEGNFMPLPRPGNVEVTTLIGPPG